jgi:fatty acid desaturase
MTGKSTMENRHQYVSPTSDLKGVTIACVIFILFILFWYHALFQINLFKTNWLDIIGTFCILEFLYTGLFITCHDAMHGAVSFRVSFVLP